MPYANGKYTAPCPMRRAARGPLRFHTFPGNQFPEIGTANFGRAAEAAFGNGGNQK